MTSPIKVQRGFPQGDSLSPPLFNLIVNTLIKTVKSEKVECMGYVYQGCLSPKHWFQFPDDTAIKTALEKDNQLLSHFFLKWITWADLIICMCKCHTFGIKKSQTKSEQFQPHITIRKERIPPIQNGKSFTYLGKNFNFSMNCEEIKNQLSNEIVKYVEKIYKLPIKCLHQIENIQCYVIPKLKWQFFVYNLSETWISENLDSRINRYYQKW